jgi:Gas vesicle synthesis protein GvpL/GvpF
VLYVYAIAECSNPPDVAGLRGARLHTLGEDGLCAIVSAHEQLQVRPTEEDLWAHERVVEALMDAGSVLPVRLGTVMADEAAVLQSLADRRRELEAALERVRGAVELGIRAAVTAAAPDDGDSTGAAATDGPGTAYMRARLLRERRGSEAAARIHEPLAFLARASTVRVSAQKRPLLRASYLVDRDRIDDFLARVEELDERGEATIVCTGPWPPYSFSSPEAAR